MANKEASRVREHVSVSVGRIGVPADVEAALSVLSRRQLSERCRKALAELEGLDSPRISIEKTVAISLFAACWTLAASDADRMECRGAITSLSELSGEKVDLDRDHVVRLVSGIVRANQ